MSLGLVFSPQGSQQVGMGRELAEASPAARAAFEEADDTLGWSVSALCWEGPADRLDDTRQTQPCLLATSVAAHRALAERVDPTPAMLAGHSVGEYAALVAGGVLDFAAALRLVARRAELMAAAGGAGQAGGMDAVLGLQRRQVEEIVANAARPTELAVANDNAPGQIVVSGRLEALSAVEEPFRAAGARRVLRLPVSGPFHSPLMSAVAGDLAEAFERETWRDAAVPIVSNVTAEPLTDARRIRALLAEQVRSPVEWVRSIERMAAGGVETIVECGPGTALTGMIRRIAPGVRIANVGDRAGLDAAARLLGQAAPTRVTV